MKINLPDKLYYSIGEVANAFNVNTSKIRHWEKEFPILKPRRNAKGNRYFTPEDIKNLKMICNLVEETSKERKNLGACRDYRAIRIYKK